MPQNVAIYGYAPDIEEIPESLRSMTGEAVHVEAQDGQWSSITIQGRNATLVFRCLRPGPPPDDFSRGILGIYNYAKRIKATSEEIQKELLHHLANAKCIIAVVATPGFDVDAGHPDLIAEVCDRADGVLFNGRDFLNVEWDVLLGADGSSEVE